MVSLHKNEKKCLNGEKFFIVFTSAIQIQGFKHCALKLRDIQFKIRDAQFKI